MSFKYRILVLPFNNLLDTDNNKLVYIPMNKNFYWLALSKVNGVGNKTLLNISNRNKEMGIGIEEFWNLAESRVSEQYAIRKQVIEEIIRKREDSSDVNALQDELNTKGVKIITIEDESYPAQLKEMDEPPFILYAYGNLDLLNENLVAIVGSRDISNEGLALTYKFSNLLMEQRITVLRGDTRDIDTITHIATRDTEGFEIIVLSDGILANLYKLRKGNKQIDESKTLILSFTDPHLHWTPYWEIRRNQLIFSLSDNIIVVEAREGGIIMDEGTKALEKGKKLFVLRYEEYPKSASANKFLIEKGAKPISSVASTQNLREVIESVTGAETIEKTEQKKDLGQYFTPQTVVKFMYDITKTLCQKENPKIIDPACGEGIFLKYALEEGITDGDNLYGCDIDRCVREKWNALELLSKIKLFIHNGLLDSKELGIERDKFDLVIGNPPYGGIGLGELVYIYEESKPKSRTDKTAFLFEKEKEIGKKELVAEKEAVYPSSPITQERKKELILLANTLGEFYETWKKGDITETTAMGKQESVGTRHFEGFEDLKPGKKRVDLIVERIQRTKLLGKAKEQLHLLPKELKKLISYPIEILFIERFLQLAKLGGYIAIIIPDGVLANINLQYVREWIFEQARILAIVSLPRETFKYIGTTAKTSIIFMQKFNVGQTLESTKKLPIFMASADYAGINHEGKNDLSAISRKFKKFFQGKKIVEGHMSPMFTSATGKDVLKVHRLDPEYWDPKYEKLIKVMEKTWKTKELGKFETVQIIPSDHVRKSKGEHEGPKYSINYYTPAGFLETGYDTVNIPRCSKNAYERMKRTQVVKDDILLGGFGMGPTGRSLLIHFEPKKSIVGNIFIIRSSNPIPHFLVTFLKSRYGISQLERMKAGVAFYSLSSDEVKALKIPLFSLELQKQIKKGYKEMLLWHDKAMEVKRKLIDGGMSNKEAEKDAKYQRNIKKAEAMLKDLIKKTEEIIEGKRKEL